MYLRGHNSGIYILKVSYSIVFYGFMIKSLNLVIKPFHGLLL